ncbi:MAG TPA: aldo/keto reductase [Bryobacteraceae bacterium]|nr:aldo/keto reductase [Bryobacteraceae bacterium]
MDSRTLGRTGLQVGRLGMAASYGVPTAAVERAFERGVNYLYWGTFRRGGFGQALRNLQAHRDRMTLVLQSYSRVAALLSPSVEMALRKVRFDYADALLLGLWGSKPPRRILDACRKLKQRGLIRHIAISTHRRPLVAELAADPDVGIVHVRYNAVHKGAEREIFPQLAGNGRDPGLVAFTATSWRQLLNPKRVPPGERVPTAADCYRFVLSHPAVDVCMTGPANEAQADEALRAVELGPMNEEDLAWMRRVGDYIHKH